MSQSRFFLLILTLFVFPSAAAGQGLTPRIIPPLAATGELKAGTWVRYILMVRKSREVIGVRLSALEVEGKAQWFELAITDPKRRTLIFKALVEGTLDNPKGVTKVIVQPPGQRPLLVPASQEEGNGGGGNIHGQTLPLKAGWSNP